jgi:putative transcriptional regulator
MKRERPPLEKILIRGMEAAIAHDEGRKKLPFNMVQQLAPPPPKRYTAREVQRVREHLNMTQAAFARLLYVSSVTVQEWEQGHRVPSHAAARLLQFIENPEALQRITQSARQAGRPEQERVAETA